MMDLAIKALIAFLLFWAVVIFIIGALAGHYLF